MDRYHVQAASFILGLIASAVFGVVVVHWHGHAVEFDRDHDVTASIDP